MRVGMKTQTKSARPF